MASSESKNAYELQTRFLDQECMSENTEMFA